MPKFRKKPVVIEAVQWTGTNHDEVREFMGQMDRDGANRVSMTTTHGDTAWAAVGDWIVPEAEAGRFYPIAADVFKRTYDPLEVAPGA